MDTGNNGADAADERRGDRRGQGADLGLPGRVRPVERPADHRGDQERHQPVPRLALRRRTQLGLEREQLGQRQERPSEDRSRRSATGATRWADRSASRAAPTSCSSSTATNTGRARAAGQVNRFRVPTALERAGDFSQSTDKNGNPIPNLVRLHRRQRRHLSRARSIPADRLYQPGMTILKLWPAAEHDRAQLQLRGRAADGEHADPAAGGPARLPAAIGVARSPASTPGRCAATEVNSIGGAAAPGTTARIPGFNDYVEPYPWIGTISVTNNFTLNFDDVPRGDLRLGAERARLDDHHARSRTVSTPGLGDLPLLFPDAGVIDSRYYEIKPLEASGHAVLPGRPRSCCRRPSRGATASRMRRRTWASPGS